VGGTGWDVGRRFIFQEEIVRANTPELSPFGLSMVGPLLIQFGNAEQKARFLPKILSGDEVWCQGYSEPNSGSDLASLQLRAEKDGDDYILNGQKTWTTYAQYADWIFVLARTNADGKKQEGISFLLADIKNTPGITVKPFLTTGGTDAFSETWFKDARVPQKNRVGPENGGWAMAKALLGHERTLIGGIAESGKWLQRVKRIARETPVGDGTLFDDPAFRRRIAKLEMRYRVVTLANLRTLAAAQLGRAPGAESSILKIVGTELYQEATELAMDAMGHDAMGWYDAPAGALPEHERWVASQFNYLRAATIYGGSNEIQKNIIAKQILRLPGA
jgi:alkylation response protein AidB-like acyl-CoA dehydrogenase